MRNTDRPSEAETSQSEHDRVRSSNDRDQEMEREGVETEHNRGYDEAVGRQFEERGEDIDPDSAESQVDRDDMITE